MKELAAGLRLAIMQAFLGACGRAESRAQGVGPQATCTPRQGTRRQRRSRGRSE